MTNRETKSHGEKLRKTPINFDIGALTSNAKNLPGTETESSDINKNIVIKSSDNLNLFLLDRKIRKSLQHSPEKLDVYKATVRAIITSYSLLVPYTESNVVKSPKQDRKNGQDKDEISLLTKRFVTLASAFANLVMTEQDEDNNHYICIKCEGPLEERGETLWCPECLRVHPDRMKTDIQIVNETTSRNINDKLSHFKLIPQLFQGKEDYTINIEDLEKIESYAERFSIELESVNKDTLADILQHTGLTKELGEHMNLLHYTITGIEPPNISHLEENIISRHQQVITAYGQLKLSERRYVLKLWYLFYQYLVMEEYDVDPRTLPIVRLKDSLDWHNRTFSRICKNLTEQGSKFVWHCVEVT